jgi:DNA-binding response OmpR family regulator
MALRVLVVDDDPMILELIEEVITSHGADVVTSDFPPNIEGLVRQFQPDVLLLDLTSPTDSLAGVVMLGRLYDALQGALQLPVLIMSADHGWLSALKDGLHSVGVAVVPKPFDIHHLWAMIKQAAQRSSSGALPN